MISHVETVNPAPLPTGVYRPFAGQRTRVVILGATGSIGVNTLDVIRQHPDRFEIVALVAQRQVEPLLAAAREFHVPHVVLENPAAAMVARSHAWSGLTVGDGEQAVIDCAAHGDVDVVVNALVGAAGLAPTLAALRAGHIVALANKESLVLGGELVQEASRTPGAALLPVDSEHSGLFQLLDGRRSGDVRRLWLTASGGALRGWPLDRLGAATPDEVLAHPTWRMGPRITVDCATLLNKGFEVLETRWLFDVPLADIGVVLHPQSLVHAFAELVDGSLLAQISATDMRLPIQYALSFPERWDPPAPALHPTALGELTFAEPDMARYPCLALARAAGEAGGTAPAVLNAADEVAVAAFLDGTMSFAALPDILARVVGDHRVVHAPRLEDIVEADAWAREQARRYL